MSPPSGTENDEVTATECTAVSIDFRYYPQIMDMVWASAPAESLIRLRTTCRDFKERADALLFRHCSSAQFGWDAMTLTLFGNLLQTAAGHRIPALLDKTPEAVFGKIKILDVHGELNDYIIDKLDLDMVRTVEYGDSEIPIMGDLRVSTHVHFTSLSHDTEEEMYISEHLKRLVLHVQYNLARNYWCAGFINIRPDSYRYVDGCKITDLVVIFEPAAHDTDEIDCPPEYPSDPLWQILFVYLAFLAERAVPRLTFVDLAASPELCSRLFTMDTSPSPEAMAGYIRERITKEREWVDKGDEIAPATLQEAFDKIEFLDSTTYRDRVGDEGWRLQTDRSLFLRPEESEASERGESEEEGGE